MNRALLILLLLAIYALPASAGQDQEKAHIEWKPIEGAISYTVEITDVYDELILEKTTDSTKLEVILPYGKYKYRVGMLTKFNKVSGWSEWHTLMIVPALEPEILSATPVGLPGWSGNHVTIKGKNFCRMSVVTVKKANSALGVKNVRYIDPETLTATVDASGAVPGSKYDLEVKNPGDLLDLKAAAPNLFTILERPKGLQIEYYAGLELGYYTFTLGLKDPYRGSLGFKLFYEFRSLFKSHPALSFLNKVPGLYPGLLLSWSGFLKPASGFGSSNMLQAGVYLGYDFSFPLKGSFNWHVAPIIGYKQYFRWHTYDDKDYFGTRPILFLGGTFDFDLPAKFFIGISLEYDVIFEIQPVNVMGVFIRCGYKL